MRPTRFLESPRDYLVMRVEEKQFNVVARISQPRYGLSDRIEIIARCQVYQQCELLKLFRIRRTRFTTTLEQIVGVLIDERNRKVVNDPEANVLKCIQSRRLPGSRHPANDDQT